jgi:hypothetical protein
MSPSNSKGSKLNERVSARQERVATCLAAGYPVARAARECRVGECTIWGWLKQPAFRERVSELRKELTDRAIGRLADMMAGAAADTLLKLLEAKSDSVRLDSVKAVYELFVNVTNAADLKDRLERLEANHPRGSR